MIFAKHINLSKSTVSDVLVVKIGFGSNNSIGYI